MSFIDAASLQQKALQLIERHINQLLEGGPVAQSSAIHIQNYAKTLVVIAKDQREQQHGIDPAGMTDEELESLIGQAVNALNQEPEDAPDDTPS